MRGANCGGRERELEHGIVDTGEVAGAAGLELLGLEGEGVHVDARGGGVRVVLVRLDLVEVAAQALRESVVAVELNLADNDGVTEVVIRVGPGAVGPGMAVNVGGVLDREDELLARVVEGHLNLVGARGD